MIPDSDFIEIQSRKESGSSIYGWFGIKFLVAAKRLPDPKQHKQLRYALNNAEQTIREAYYLAMAEENAEFMAGVQAERQMLLDDFPKPNYHEEIPNEYENNSWYGKLHPWYRLTVPNVGHFKVGWRKRVIYLDWQETRVTATAEQLFPNEDTTKLERGIHAWSHERLRHYFQIIIAAAPSA